MATLISQDSSGVLLAQEGEQEIQRTRSAKKFLVQRFADGRTQYRIGASIGPIHYNDDVLDASGEWHEIDLDLLPVTGKGWNWECTTNGYSVRVWRRYGLWAPYTACFLRAGQWVRMSPLALCYENSAGERQVISRPVTGIAGSVDNEAHTITWAGCFGAGIDFRYNLAPDKFFKTVTVDSLDALPLPTIAEDGLRLTVLMALSWSGQAGNGFGAEQDLSVLPSAEPEDTADEEIPDFAAFSVLRTEDAREALWLQTPRSWDAEGADIPMQYQLRRYGSKVIGAFSVAAEDLEGRAFPVSVDTAITEEEISADADDLYSGGTTYPTGADNAGDYYYNAFGKSGGYYYCAAWRYLTVPIPNAATIDSAAMTFVSQADSSTATTITIAAEDVDSAAAIVSNSHTPSDAYGARTSTTVAWSIGSWTLDSSYTSPSMKTIVQEIVDREGWASDNNMLFLYYAASTETAAARKSYDWGYNAAKGAKFNCTYTVAGTTYYVTLSETATATETVPCTPKRGLSETATASEIIARQADRTLAEIATGQDALARTVARLLSETATGTDTLDLSRLIAILLSETVTGADALAKLVERSLPETATGTDSTTLSALRTLAEEATGTDGITRALSRGLSETATGTDALQRVAARTLEEQAEAADTITRVVARALTEQAGLNDDISRLLARALTDTLDATDLLSSHLAQVYQVTLTELVTATDTLSRQQLLILAVTLAAQIINARLEAETLNATLVARTLNARLDAEAIDATQTTRTLNTRGEGE